MAAKQKQDHELAGAITAAIKRARDLAIKEAAKEECRCQSCRKRRAATAKTTRPADQRGAGSTRYPEYRSSRLQQDGVHQ